MLLLLDHKQLDGKSDIFGTVVVCFTRLHQRGIFRPAAASI